MKTGGVSTGLNAALVQNPIEEEPALDLGLPETAALKRVRGLKRGRPAGAMNKRTVQTAERLIGRFGDPLEKAVQIAVMPIDELQAAMGCTKLEALQEQRLWTLAALPFLHQKRPIAVDLTNHKVVHLVIEDGPEKSVPAPDGEEVINLLATEIEADE